MKDQRTRARRTWHTLTEEKQERLAALRRRQQREIEIEPRMLRHHGR